MKAEDQFEIHIPREEYLACETVGAFIDLVHVCCGLTVPGRDYCRSSRAFYRIRRVLGEQLGLGRRDVRPSSRLDALIPKPDRRRDWRELDAIGLNRPEIDEARWGLKMMPAFALIPYLGFCLISGSPWLWLGTVPLLIVIVVVNHPALARPAFETVVGAAHQLVRQEHASAGATDTAALEYKIRRLIAEQANVRLEEVTRNKTWTELERDCTDWE